MTDLRRCIGSIRFGIEAHDAPPGDFPVQPSQKDGLGRMCKAHWNQYTAGLARNAKARKAADAAPEAATATVDAVQPARGVTKAHPTPRPSPRKGRPSRAPTVKLAQDAATE